LKVSEVPWTIKVVKVFKVFKDLNVKKRVFLFELFMTNQLVPRTDVIYRVSEPFTI